MKTSNSYLIIISICLVVIFGVHPILGAELKYLSPAETVIRQGSPVLLKLTDPKQETEPEIIVYDQISKERAYIHLAKKGAGQFEGLYNFHLGSSEYYLPRFRIDSFMQFKGWHYSYISYIENNIQIIKLDPKLVSPEKISISPTASALLQKKIQSVSNQERTEIETKAKQLMKDEHYDQAEALVRSALQKDPFDLSLRYIHGTTLFHQKNFLPAHREFLVAAQEPALSYESTYYSGLCFYRMGQLKEAQAMFEKTALSNNSQFHTSAQNYLKLIAQHHSENPISIGEDSKNEKKMNQEVTNRQPSPENPITKRFSGFASLDFFQYDSNVVTLPDSLVSISNAGGLGLAGAVGLNAILFKPGNFEFDLNYQLNWTYHYNSELISYDLWTHTFSAPVVHYLEVGNARSRFTYQPGVSLITFQQDGQRIVPPSQAPIKTFFLNTKEEFTLSLSQLLTTQLNVSYDQNDIVSDVTNNGSGPRILLSGVYTHYLESKRSRSWYAGPAIEWFNSSGINYKQFKLSSTLGYQTPTIWGINARPEFDILYDNWYAHQKMRRDLQLKVGITFSKSLSSATYLSNTINYTGNLSNIDVGQYDRFVFGLSMGVLF